MIGTLPYGEAYLIFDVCECLYCLCQFNGIMASLNPDGFEYHKAIFKVTE